MSRYRVHGVIHLKFSQNTSEKFLKHRPKCSNDERGPTLDVVAAAGDAHVSHYQAIHASNEVEHLRVRSPERNEAVNNARDRAGQHCVGGYDLRGYVELQRDHVLSEAHVDEQIAYEDQEDAQDGVWQSLWVVVEVPCHIHVVDSDQRIEVPLFDLHEAQFFHFEQQL